MKPYKQLPASERDQGVPVGRRVGREDHEALTGGQLTSGPHGPECDPRAGAAEHRDDRPNAINDRRLRSTVPARHHVLPTFARPPPNGRRGANLALRKPAQPSFEG